jgi:hypothetical protein
MRFVFVWIFAIAALIMQPQRADAAPLTYPDLKTMVENLGYTSKEISKAGENPKFEVNASTQGFNVPIGFEVSPSGRYIWASANLGSASGIDGARALELLKKNFSIQPTSFWITGAGNLSIGMPIDNREVTPVHLKFVIDKLAGDVGATSSTWQVPAH